MLFFLSLGLLSVQFFFFFFTTPLFHNFRPVGRAYFFFFLFGLLALLRYLSFRETMMLAEKGLVRPDRTRGNGKDTLRWGIAITAIGLALCLGLYPIGFLAGRSFPLGFGPWMLAGLIPTFFGLALVLIYVLTREAKPKEEAPKTEKPAEPPSEGA